MTDNDARGWDTVKQIQDPVVLIVIGIAILAGFIFGLFKEASK